MEHCAPQRLVTAPSAPYQWVQSKPHCKGRTRRPPAPGCLTTAVGAPTCCRRGQPRAAPIPQHSGSPQALQDTLWPRGIPFPACPVCSPPHMLLPCLVAPAQSLGLSPSSPLLLSCWKRHGARAARPGESQAWDLQDPKHPHKNTGWWRLEGTSGDHPVQLPC